MKIQHIILICYTVLAFSCGGMVDHSEEIQTEITVTLNPNIKYQTIHGFGASDAWSCQFVGRWPDPSRSEIAELLFSTELSSRGRPQGIGLSMWRFNIGAGSAHQGEASDISDPWRRAECFLTESEELDFSRHPGQRWFLRVARDYGVEKITGFANSPPVHYTKNGRAYASDPNSANLAEDHFDDYARFLRDVLLGIHQNDGVLLDYVSPVNEPQWDWTNPSQEGSPWTNEDIYHIVAELQAALTENHVSTQINIPESAQYNYMYSDNTNKPERDNQFLTFFGGLGNFSVDSLRNVAPIFSTHSYFTTWPVSNMILTRQNAFQNLQSGSGGIELEMSEYCILENNPQIKGNGRDLGINPALYMGRVIHHDLTIANASAWQWWLAISPYDYKDGLIYIDKNENGGNYYESKLLWALGNYSRFIRPGMHRIGVTRSDNLSLEAAAEDLMLSAYAGGGDNELVLVAVNYSHNKKTINLNTGQMSFRSITAYITSGIQSDNLRPQDYHSQTELVIPARSITTFVVR